MQAQPLELRAPEWAIRSDRTTGATPLKAMVTAQLTGPAMFVPRLWRRQNSRRLTQANDLRMRPQGQIQHRCAAVAETSDEQQSESHAAHRLCSTKALRSVVICSTWCPTVNRVLARR